MGWSRIREVPRCRNLYIRGCAAVYKVRRGWAFTHLAGGEKGPSSY
jgi:hypothetical protein